MHRFFLELKVHYEKYFSSSGEKCSEWCGGTWKNSKSNVIFEKLWEKVDNSNQIS